jgi:hypothetical protein
MRGADITQEELFSYRPLEERIPKKHPLRKLRKVVDLLLATLDDEFDALYARPRPGFDSAGTPATRQLAASAIFHPLGAAVGGAHRFQSAVPLVCRLDDG